MPKQDDTRDLLLKSQYRKWLAEHPPDSKPFEKEPSETGDILDLVNDANVARQKAQEERRDHEEKQEVGKTIDRSRSQANYSARDTIDLVRMHREDKLKKEAAEEQAKVDKILEENF